MREKMAEIEVHIDKRVINPVYRPLLNLNTRTQIIFGGSSSGKSVFAIGQRLVLDLMMGNRNYLCVRNVARMIRSSVFNEIVKGIERVKAGHLFSINKSEMTVTCANGYQAIMSGLDDVEKIKSITPRKGVITDILVEEATEASRDDITQLRKRLRGVSEVKKRITLIFNPIFKTHWIFQDYFAGKWHDGQRMMKDEDVFILKTTYKDNRSFLEEDDIRELEGERNPYAYDVYTLGNWGVLGHLVFDNWRVEDVTGIKHYLENYNNGLDFGFTNDPTVLSQSCPTKKGVLYVVDEMHEKGLTNPQIASRIKPIVGSDIVRCDPSAPKDIMELNSHNINATAASGGRGSILHGIQWLKQFEIIIDKTCQNHVNEFQLYQWETDKAGEPMNKPVDKFNHCIDALRYGNSHQYMDVEEEAYSIRRVGVF